MTSTRRDIGREILEGLREVKRGELVHRIEVRDGRAIRSETRASQGNRDAVEHPPELDGEHVDDVVVRTGLEPV